MNTLPKTESRIMENTSEYINERLNREIEVRVFYLAQNPDQIDARLDELDEEWDIERLLQTQAAGLSLFGILMASHNRKWLLLPFAVAGFLLQHALQGWCPPVPILRRLGVRTTREINIERYALKALRGDFEQVGSDLEPTQKAKAALASAQRHL